MEAATEGSDLLRTLKNKVPEGNKNVDLKNVSRDSPLNAIAQAPPSTYRRAQIHDCAESEPGKRQL